ncbi:MAG: hypothetical protein EZS28_041566 [Streblomastix strix]|uniref:Uncharacterized protein n=1 Tax=Streblomastix strix TaxID=222440 RepID=A0A5J4TXB5_9EUKA|nr:MAG: hypothetical protein EZS28_041566 [Streblomastix strix]
MKIIPMDYIRTDSKIVIIKIEDQQEVMEYAYDVKIVIIIKSVNGSKEVIGILVDVLLFTSDALLLGNGDGERLNERVEGAFGVLVYDMNVIMDADDTADYIEGFIYDV